MFVNVVCHPPLGQYAIIPHDSLTVTFNVIVESNRPSDGETWEVAIWHNHGEQWEALPLRETTEGGKVVFIGPEAHSSNNRYSFLGELRGKPKGPRPVSFTVKFRRGAKDRWKWVRDEFSARDGLLYYQTSSMQADDLSCYFDSIGSSVNVTKEKNPILCPDTALWSVTSGVKAAVGRESGYSRHILGKPSNFTRWFALVRIWSPWLAPRHGQHRFENDKDASLGALPHGLQRLGPDKDAILTAFLRHDGIHVVAIAVSGVDDVLTVFDHDGDGNVIISGRNDNEEDAVSRVIVAAGKTFESANAAAMYHARKLVGAHAQKNSSDQDTELKTLLQDVKPQWLENWYDGFSYCTWNGLGQNLTAEKIDSALSSLREANINITNLIIDDNWQSLDNEGENQMKRGWLEFEANKRAFPQGLKHTISSIRTKYEHISHIAVWHAILGYWGGISPDGAIAKEYKTLRARTRAGGTGGSILIVDPEDAQRYYSDFYKFLSDSGIDAVKTDAQFMLDELEDADVRKSAIRRYQDVWTINSLRYFSIKAISCMSQLPQILFHSQLPTNKPAVMVRNSDDFFPGVAESHPWHIFCNAHNSLFTQHLNTLPDWDMFQTGHPLAKFHAAARCVSGGPIYFTDEPDNHDLDLIYQMTAQTPRGNTIILRPHTVGKSTQAYIAYDELSALKVSTFVGMQRTGTSILGIFNVSLSALTELVSLVDFPGTETGQYVIRDHSSGFVSRPMTREDATPLVGIHLAVKGWMILSAYPLQRFELQHGRELKIANLGLVGKMTGAAAVINTDIYVEKTGRLRIWTALKALGVLGIYISDLPNMSIEDDLFILIFGKPVPFHAVRRSEDDDRVLEIDLAKAWEEGGHEAGWSNEVHVEVFVR